MSMNLMVQAMKAKVGNPLRKLVLIKLADNANDDGECWPSYKHIADQCEIARSTVKAHIKQLEKDGFLCIEHRKEGALNKTNLFRLTIARGRAGADPVGREPTGGRAAADPGRAAADRGGGAAADPKPVTSKNQSRNQSKNHGADALPDWLPQAAWANFVAFRKKVRKPLTDRAAVLAIQKLDQLRQQGNPPALVIDQSILNGWAGLFPLKGHPAARPERTGFDDGRRRVYESTPDEDIPDFVSGGPA